MATYLLPSLSATDSWEFRIYWNVLNERTLLLKKLMKIHHKIKLNQLIKNEQRCGMANSNFTGCSKKKIHAYAAQTGLPQRVHNIIIDLNGNKIRPTCRILQVPPSAGIFQKLICFLDRKAISGKLYTACLNLGQFSGIIFVSSHQI